VLNSVTKITIGRDSRMTVVTENNSNKRRISRAKSMSFRSVNLDQHQRNNKASVDVDMARLAREADLSMMPRRARQREARSKSANFDFTQIFNELSNLSKEVSKRLEDDDAEEPKVKPNKSHSLRQTAVKNATIGSKQQPSSSPVMLLRTPERLRDIRTLDAKLAAIKSDLDGN